MILTGDCLTILPTLPPESVQMVCTSPPYYGLRDYGCAGQIGLEPTPEAYVEKLVAVFREVRRVLREDGTLWLNLGQSYAGYWGDKYAHKPFGDDRTADESTCPNKPSLNFGRRGNAPSRSPLLQRVPACGNDGKVSQDSQGADRACPGSCDEPQGEIRNRRGYTAHNDQSASQDDRQTSQTDHDTERSDYGQALLSASLPDAQESTIEQSSSLPLGACDPEATVSAFPQEAQTSPSFAQESECKTVCTSGTSRMLLPLIVRTAGKESFFSACGSPSCNGIGRCGLCWCKLAIPSLNVKPKDEINIPHLAAMALQADGWFLRQTIIWAKPNPMPESVTDRCTKAHEYIFLLTKSARYFYDHEAIKEPAAFGIPNSPESIASPYGQGFTRRADSWKGSRFDDGKNVLNHPNVGKMRPSAPKGSFNGKTEAMADTGQNAFRAVTMSRNRRSVWTITTKPFKEAHFATFPPEIPEICIKAGSRPGDTVLDPFSGSGTTGNVAERLGRKYIGLELNPAYVEMSEKRIDAVRLPLFQEGL